MDNYIMLNGTANLIVTRHCKNEIDDLFVEFISGF